MRLSHGNPNLLHPNHTKDRGGNPLRETLEVMDVSLVDDFGDQIVQLPVVYDSLVSHRTFGTLDPDGDINFNGLCELGLVRQSPDARVEHHRFESHDVKEAQVLTRQARCEVTP